MAPAVVSNYYFTSMSAALHLEPAVNGIRQVVLDRPPANSLSLELMDEIAATAAFLQEDSGTRVVVVRSAVPGMFMAGADLAMVEANWDRIDEVAARLRRAFTAWERLRCPTIAAIAGHALGGGCEWALTFDFRCMAQGKGRIGLPESQRGLLAAGGGTQRMARLLGRARALDLALRGRLLDAREAAAIGLVTTACEPDELDAATEGLAAELAALAPLTLAAIKRVILEGENLTLDEGLTLESKAMVELTKTSDALEGVRSFLERRPPRFEGT
jgi:enoyl-CoA hydratase/carnithine racemase